MTQQQKTKKARLLDVERLRTLPGMTQKQMASELGVTERQIKRDVAELNAQGKLAKKDIPFSAPVIALDDAKRDAAIEQHESTMTQIRWAIKELMTGAEKINTAVLQAVDNGELDGVLLSSWAKMYDSLTNQLTLKARVAGEWTDAPQLSIIQIDRDVEDTIGILTEYSNCPHCDGELDVGRYLYNRLIGKYPRRRGRFHEFHILTQQIDKGELTAQDVIEADFKLLEGGQ
jgi:transcriptional regulator with XRE-family HTH domain